MEIFPSLGLSKKKTDLEKLDIKDKKILIQLSKNARQPLSKIAKEVGLSRDSVQYRIHTLEKNEVLKGARTIVETGKLGYDSYHLFLRLNNPSEKVEKAFLAEVERLSYVRAILKFYGSYDYEIATLAKSIREFDAQLTEMIHFAKESLQEYEILVITKRYFGGSLPRSFYKGIETKEEKTNQRKRSSPALDEKDYALLKYLRDDPAQSLISLSGKVHLSPDAVQYRIRKMEESIILSYTPVINYQALGYSIHTLVLTITNLDESNEKKLASFMQGNENILWAVKTIGRFNVLLYVCTQDDKDLQDTVKELRGLFPDSIKNYDSFLATAEFKYTYIPDCIFEKEK